jgi:hypothetical protein
VVIIASFLLNLQGIVNERLLFLNRLACFALLDRERKTSFGKSCKSFIRKPGFVLVAGEHFDSARRAIVCDDSFRGENASNANAKIELTELSKSLCGHLTVFLGVLGRKGDLTGSYDSSSRKPMTFNHWMNASHETIFTSDVDFLLTLGIRRYSLRTVKQTLHIQSKHSY